MRLVAVLFLVAQLSAINMFAQQSVVKVGEKTYYAYLLATSDLDVEIRVLNNQNRHIVKSTDDLIKIGLDAGDNLIKITPLDGVDDGYTVIKTADKPGNIAFRADIAAKRAERLVAAQVEEQISLRMVEEERQGVFDYSLENIKQRTVWGKVPGKSVEYALLTKGSPEKKVYANIEIVFENAEKVESNKYYNEIIEGLLDDEFFEEGYNGRLKNSGVIIYASFSQTLNITIECPRDYFEKVLVIVSEKIRNPLYSESEFLNKKTSLSNSYKRRDGHSSNTRSSILEVLRKSFSPGQTENNIPIDKEINLINELNISGLESARKELIEKSHVRVSAVGDFNLKLVKETIHKEFYASGNPQPYKKTTSVEDKCADLIDDVTVYLPGTNKIGRALILPTGIKKGDNDYEIMKIFVNIMLDRSIKTLGMINLGDCLSQCEILLPVTIEDCYIEIGFYDCIDYMCAKKLCEICQSILLNINDRPISNDELEKYKRENSIEIEDDQNVQFYLERSFEESNFFEKLESLHLKDVTAYQINLVAKKYIKLHKIVTIQSGNIK